ncbi:MAG: carboxylating nicotinate-nucleotide diphosphorylase [Bosea sp. (in: a-proteobacteria)]
MTGTLNPHLIRDAIHAALNEDLGRAGDITTLATIPAGRPATAVIAMRKAGVLAGMPLAREAFRQSAEAHSLSGIHAPLTFTALANDSAALKAGAQLARIEGDARALLSGERIALNFLGRMSGIATLTAAYVAKVSHTSARIVDTRKTTPGLRAFEKYAVRCGGGMNHRFGLDDAILIKDNHIAVAGGIAAALKAAKRAAGHLVKIEIEVDNLNQLDEVIAEGADVVLLDNMTPAMLAEAVRRVKASARASSLRTEASGGVSLESVAAIAESGVDMISVGALTHSAPVLDLGLDVVVG